MIIDSHGHVTAPDSLYVYKAQILAHRGAHGRGGNLANDDDVRKALNSPVFGGSSHLDQLKEVGTDMQLVSPRPYQMMTSESPKLVQWFVEETNNIIAKQVELYPNTFRGVCGLAFFGVDHVLFASDAPFDPEKGPMYIRETIAIVDKLPVSNEERERIYWKNAAALLPISANSLSTPCSFHCRMSLTNARNRFTFSPPHSPLSVDTTT